MVILCISQSTIFFTNKKGSLPVNPLSVERGQTDCLGMQLRIMMALSFGHERHLSGVPHTLTVRGSEKGVCPGTIAVTFVRLPMTKATR